MTGPTTTTTAPAPTASEAEREALRQRWRRLRGSQMPPISTSLGLCGVCCRRYGVDAAGRLNEHNDATYGLRCTGSRHRAGEVTPL